MIMGKGGKLGPFLHSIHESQLGDPAGVAHTVCKRV